MKFWNFGRSCWLVIVLTILLISACDGNINDNTNRALKSAGYKFKEYSDGSIVYQIKLFCGDKTYEYLTDFTTLNISDGRVSFSDCILGISVRSTCDFLYQPVLEKIEESNSNDKWRVNENILNNYRTDIGQDVRIENKQLHSEDHTQQSPITINNYQINSPQK